MGERAGDEVLAIENGQTQDVARECGQAVPVLSLIGGADDGTVDRSGEVPAGRVGRQQATAPLDRKRETLPGATAVTRAEESRITAQEEAEPSGLVGGECAAFERGRGRLDLVPAPAARAAEERAVGCDEEGGAVALELRRNDEIDDFDELGQACIGGFPVRSGIGGNEDAVQLVGDDDEPSCAFGRCPDRDDRPALQAPLPGAVRLLAEKP